MTFEEVLPKLKEGKKAFRLDWCGIIGSTSEIYEQLNSGLYDLPSSEKIIFIIKDKSGQLKHEGGFKNYVFSDEDILADDWEVIE